MVCQPEIAIFRQMFFNKCEMKDVLALFSQLLTVHNAVAAAIRLFDHFAYSLVPESFERFTSSERLDIMQCYHDYVRLLRSYLRMPSPCDNREISKLLGFEQVPNDESNFLIRKNTILLPYLTTATSCPGNGSPTNRWDLNYAIKQVLKSRLCDVTKFFFGIASIEEDGELPESFGPSLLPRVFMPCPHFILFRQCNRQPCQYEHVEPDRSWFNERLHAVVLQLSTIWEAGFTVGAYRSSLHLCVLSLFLS